MQKREYPHYLQFTRKERNGIIMLLFFILLMLALPFAHDLFSEQQHLPVNSDLQECLAALRVKKKDAFNRAYPTYDNKDLTAGNSKNLPRATAPAELFRFDPNTLPAEGWQKLGIREKTIHTITNYLQKGGKFREPGDLKKIWGLHEDEVKRLLPYVEIKSVIPLAVRKEFQDSRPQYQHTKEIQKVDINMADSAAWIALPGIGPKLSGRIVSFRNKLGGFHRVEQVGETFGLPDSVFRKIRPMLVYSGNAVRQININTAGIDEMKSHPYIRYQLAGQILQYRNQHGSFSDKSDLRKLMPVTAEMYEKLAPYITVHP